MNKYFNNLYIKDNIKDKLLKFWQNNKDINDFLEDFFCLITENKINE